MWRIYCCLTSFFPIVDTWLSCEDIARQSCAMVCRSRFLRNFCLEKFSYGAKAPKMYIWCTSSGDGPAKHRAKFGWLLLRSAVTKARRETHLLGCPKLSNRSQSLVGWSSPYCAEIWRTYCCLTSFFFQLSIHALVAKTLQDQVVRWCTDGDFLCHFCLPYLQRAACSTCQTCILNLH